MGEKIERYSSLKFKKWLHLKQVLCIHKEGNLSYGVRSQDGDYLQGERGAVSRYGTSRIPMAYY